MRWAGEFDLATAVTLGADVPFCLRGGRAHVSGIGEIIDDAPFEQHTFVLLTPALSVVTAAVYKAFDEGGDARGGANDLERAALFVEPRLEQWRDLLAKATGKQARLAGSGASWFIECERDQGSALATHVKDAVMKGTEAAAVTLCQAVPAQSR